MSAEALLASWSDTATRDVITTFVAAVGDGGPQTVPAAERIAVFDNDGTLWTEKPYPIQLAFTLHRLVEQAADDPSLAARQPYRAAIDGDARWLSDAMVKHYHGDDDDLHLLAAAVSSAFAGMSVDDFAASVSAWFRTARHPTSGRSFLRCAYRPMLELLQYLEANGFHVYIASGGDRDFMRPFAEQLYGIPPERVIGSALGLSFAEGDGGPGLLYKSKVEMFDDGPEKPVRIWSRIGRRPIVAAGNSNGDAPMLRFAGAPGGAALRLLVHHDDADREVADAAGAEDALQLAGQHGWTVVSMRDDWTTVFDDE